MLNAYSRCLLVFLSCVVCAGAALSQEIPDRVRACASESNDARRLDCYDRAVGRTSPAPTTTPPTPSAAAAAPSVPEPSATEKFGYRGTIAREEMERRAAQGDSLERLEATVVEVVKQPRGELTLTLDNGQVWTQKTADALRIRAGDRVVIKSASFGSFLLVAPNNKSSRVVRQR